MVEFKLTSCPKEAIRVTGDGRILVRNKDGVMTDATDSLTILFQYLANSDQSIQDCAVSLLSQDRK